MNFDEALGKMGSGETVEHGGRKFQMHGRALYDVTAEGDEPKRVPIMQLSAEEWAKLAP